MQCAVAGSLQASTVRRNFPKFLQCLQPKMSKVLWSFQGKLSSKGTWVWWSMAELPVSAEGAVALGSFHCQICSLGSFRPINVNFTREITCRTSVSDSRIDAYFFHFFFFFTLFTQFNVYFITFSKGCSKVCEHFRKRTTRTAPILVKIQSVIFVLLYHPLCLLE